MAPVYPPGIIVRNYAELKRDGTYHGTWKYFQGTSWVRVKRAGLLQKTNNMRHVHKICSIHSCFLRPSTWKVQCLTAHGSLFKSLQHRGGPFGLCTWIDADARVCKSLALLQMPYVEIWLPSKECCCTCILFPSEYKLSESSSCSLNGPAYIHELITGTY